MIHIQSEATLKMVHVYIYMKKIKHLSSTFIIIIILIKWKRNLIDVKGR